MPAAAKNAYLVNKITFLQNRTFIGAANILYPSRKDFYMKKTLLVSLTALVLTSCGNNNTSKDKTANTSIPSCLQETIKALEKGKETNPPVQIDEYFYNGKRIFLYTADCCDQFNVAYDENCNPVCAPTGGMEGGGDHKCPDFSTAARWVTLVWEKPAEK